jgi:endonuclease YncB( thermonuclease family)
MTTAAAAALFVLLLTAEGHSATTLQGRVAHVIDGDGLILVVGTRHVNVRLAGIDAPERAQPFGAPSRQSLQAMCGGKLASVIAKGKDRHGRTVAHVNCAGTDAYEEQVRRGMAWVFDGYVKPDSALYTCKQELARRGAVYGQNHQPCRHGSGGKHLLFGGSHVTAAA